MFSFHCISSCLIFLRAKTSLFALPLPREMFPVREVDTMIADLIQKVKARGGNFRLFAENIVLRFVGAAVFRQLAIKFSVSWRDDEFPNKAYRQRAGVRRIGRRSRVQSAVPVRHWCF